MDGIGVHAASGKQGERVATAIALPCSSARLARTPALTAAPAVVAMTDGWSQ
jgi:hypothetical protein